MNQHATDSARSLCLPKKTGITSAWSVNSLLSLQAHHCRKIKADNFVEWETVGRAQSETSDARADYGLS
jgi:hypothetical protein